MKLHVVSDLHFEFDPEWQLPRTESDVLILAGDVAPGLRGMARFAHYRTPVIYVPGNHEYYGESLEGMRQAMALCAGSFGIRLLDQGELRLPGVRFLGVTLWTDFRLFGEHRVTEATDYANNHLNDYISIRAGGRLLSPGQTIGLHESAVAWLEAKLAEPFEGETVVITHHGPHPRSLHPRHAVGLLNAAYTSDLSRLMGRAALWVHGHTHCSLDYLAGGTRVLCNPKGYRNENRDFDPGLVVTV